MSKCKMPSDATIEGVINTLDNPKEYVRGVVENMHRAKKGLGPGDVYVSIGITDRGVLRIAGLRLCLALQTRTGTIL